ncbi:MAG: AmmeMemoRadiSam system protein B [Myxococcota bacterium]
MKTTPYRRTAVAGRFYPAKADALKAELAALFSESIVSGEPKKAVAVMSPHAGIMFSGRVAASVFKSVALPEYIVILAPNHTGIGARGAIISAGLWQSPLKDVEIARNLAKSLLESLPTLLKEDESAHFQEHSLEVIVPFIQFLKPDFKLVPIVLSALSADECLALAKAMKNTIDDFGKDVLVVASSDMTHYRTKAECKALDDLALERMLALDPKGLFDVVRANNISMCGVIPATVITAIARETASARPQLVDYDHSSRKTFEGDDGVAYAGVVFYSE